MTGYYDYVLGFIPVALLGVTGLLGAVGLPLTIAVPTGASAAVLLIGHAMFVNGPVADHDALPNASATSPVEGSPGGPAEQPAD